MKRKRFFTRMGEKRKFYNNMRHFGGTRNISITLLGFLPVMGFIGLIAMIAFAFMAFMHLGHGAAPAAAGIKQKSHLFTAAMAIAGLAAAAVPDFKGLMSLEQKRADLIKANEALIDAAEARNEDLNAEEQKVYDANVVTLKSVNARISRIESLRDQQAAIGAGRKKPVQAAHDPGSSIEVLDKPKFRNAGEQLMAVYRHEKTRGKVSDPRLVMAGSAEATALVAEGLMKSGMPENLAKQAAAGLNESTPAEGGFLVQGDVADGLMQRTYETGELLTLMPAPIEISSNSNRVTINGIDESSRANGSRFGGVQAFWTNEAGTITQTKPKFRKIELVLNKLVGLCYATDEMVADSAVLDSVINNIFPQEFSFRIEDGIVNGPGNGQPLGFANSPALIVVNKEAAQAASTVVAANIMKMWSRCWARSRKQAVWLIDQSIEPQLYQMTITTGTGISTPIYLPPGGLSGSPYGTLFGRPVILTEYNASLTNQGDIFLVDLSQMAFARKSLMQAASSMHVNFTTDEMAFRFTMRLDVQPSWNIPLAPKNGGPTLSPFVTLQAR